jgi:pimeloyl-ACP methyl ester carboxylesterase
VAELADAAEALLDRPLAIFGHSMGALLAYEVARELAGLLRSWGGTPPELLQDEEFLGLVLPPFRADLLLCDTYRYRPGTPLDTPLDGPGRRGRRCRAGARCRGVVGVFHSVARDPGAPRRPLLSGAGSPSRSRRRDARGHRGK